MERSGYILKTSDDEPAEEGQLRALKRLIAAAVKLFWLKRGSHDEGRDL